MRKLAYIVIASMIAPIVAFSETGEARPRPTVDASDTNTAYGLCLVNGGDANAGTGSGGKCAGAICYCCYDDGCFICNNIGSDCTWDQKARARTIGQRLKIPNRNEPTKATAAPVTRPPRGQTLGPGLLEGGGSLSTQGPAATGKPVAPAPPPVQLR